MTLSCLKFLTYVGLALFICVVIVSYQSHGLKKTTFKVESTENIECRIKIISQNLWCHYLVPVGPHSYERISAFVENVQNYDVVLLQEVFVLRVGPFLFKGVASFIIKEFAKYGFLYHTSFHESMPHFLGQNNGLAIFSKIPIIDSGTTIFSKSIFDFNSDYVNNKGFVWAELRFSNNKHIRFISTHMTSTTDGIDEEQKTVSIRQREIQKLSSFVSKQNVPLIITGDFNSCAMTQKDEYNYLKDSLVGLKEIVNEMNFITFYDTAKKQNQTLDLMFLSDYFNVSNLATVNFKTERGEPVSDHFGIVAELSACSL